MEDAEHVLITAFAQAVSRRWKTLHHLEEHRFSLDPDAIQQIADDAAALAASNVSWHIALGATTTARAMAEKFGRPVDHIVQEVLNGHLVGITGRHETFIPLWQFPHGQVDRHPAESVLQALKVFTDGLGDAYDPEVVVLWGASRQPELDDTKPCEAAGRFTAAELTWSAKRTVAGLLQ